jgi:putative NADH-flavin reductase
VLVLGATGGTGRCVVDVALARGWRVTALVRDPARLPVAHPDLRVVVGQVTDPAAVAAALPGHDAVVSALGQQRGSPDDLLRRAMDVVIPAMRAAGVRRLVAVSGAAVKFPGDAPTPLLERLVVPLIRTFVPRWVDDTRGYADRVADSGLDWVLVRPTALTNGRGGRPVLARDTLSYGPLASIDRADLAAFVVDALTADTWLRRTPMLTTTGARS